MDEHTQSPHEHTINISQEIEIINNNNNNNNNTKKYASVLTGLHAGHFRICVSLGSQVLLWSENGIQTQHNISHTVAFSLLWWLSFLTLLLFSALYTLRCIFCFRLVHNEFSHHINVNFFFLPSASWLFLLQVIPSVHLVPAQILLWAFLVPVVILDVKIYGQWITTEKRFLSTMANPTSQLSVVANLVGAWAAARMGWKESGVSVFTLGLVHYLVVFVTLYQRLRGAGRFPSMLRPDLFLFVAAPSMASLGWSSITGGFGLPCKMLFFLSLFLFVSLICRPVLFKKSMKRFNTAWWAYSFPITFLALASAEYAQEVKGIVAYTLMLVLSTLSVLVFIGITVCTVVNKTDRLLRRK